ncbi:hypothetical protein SJAV_07810 [Sulfurisphaera javensis]|uniref:Uncharacterized protein n=1 Tax=Sulfurisphaera javensis TaxID=2049879 RepID=A0AAT9GPL6_9CREN
MEYFRFGNLTSIVAGFLILAVLIQIAFFGLKSVFTLPILAQFWIIWILSIPAFLFYHKSPLRRKFFMNYMAPLAIGITLIGLILASFHYFLGLELIVLGYIFEPVAGISIYLTVNKILLASNLFFWGAVIYTIGLPLYLFNISEVAILGDVIKIIGLIILGEKIKERKIL